MTIWHHLVVALVSLVLGSCVGSFLNVCIHRIPIRMSVLVPGSHCPRCHRAIRAGDNVPGAVAAACRCSETGPAEWCS